MYSSDTYQDNWWFNCKGDCSNCASGTASRSGVKVNAMVIGAVNLGPEDGMVLKHKGYEIRFAYSHNPASVQNCSPDGVNVIVDVVNSMRLDVSLLTTAQLLDMDVRMVVVMGDYQRLLSTGHSVDYDTMKRLFGVPVMPVDFKTGQGLALFADSVIEAYKAGPTSKHVPFLREATLQESREAFVCGALQETLRHSKDRSDHTLTQKIDAVLTDKWLGLPLLALILFGLFEATFSLGAYPQRWIEHGVDWVASFLSFFLSPGWLSSMLVDGVVLGVGAVLEFLPNIVILFFFLSLLEDSGYMARAAFIMDKIMHKIGLHGKSFVPMLIGFGCNVPAIMSARFIDDKKDRTLTMLMIPFMSCSARLPVYMLFAGAFFAHRKALVMMSIYVTGIVLSILFAFVMKRTRFFNKEEDDFVSELPPYRRPLVKVTLRHIWERVSDYLRKISTVILAASVIIWALEYFPVERTQYGQDKEQSYLSDVGRAIAPVMKPLGFDWKMSVCILTGLPAKEAIVSTMGILYHADEGSLEKTLREGKYQPDPVTAEVKPIFTPAVAWSFMLFVLLYFPCIATIVTLKREIGGGWAFFSVVHSLLLAWTVSFLVFQIGSLFV